MKTDTTVGASGEHMGEMRQTQERRYDMCSMLQTKYFHIRRQIETFLQSFK